MHEGAYAMNLDELALLHGTDKSSAPGCHDYTPIYERYFGHLRDWPITLLEYGIGGYGDPHQGGESLRMWADYFPKATVIGVDIEHKRLDFGERNVAIYRGDQGDPGLAGRIAGLHGCFDIVIDDGAHTSVPTIAAFRSVWPHLRSGGFYVCEDTSTAYSWDGPSEGGNDPELGLDDGGPTLMQFFRRMADDLNAHGYPARFARGYQLEFAHFWRDLVIARKAAA